MFVLLIPQILVFPWFCVDFLYAHIRQLGRISFGNLVDEADYRAFKVFISYSSLLHKENPDRTAWRARLTVHRQVHCLWSTFSESLSWRLCSISEARTGAKGCRRPNWMWQWNKKNVLCEKNPVSQHGERMRNCCRSIIQDSFSDCWMDRAGTIPERIDLLPGREGPGFPL